MEHDLPLGTCAYDSAGRYYIYARMGERLVWLRVTRTRVKKIAV